MISVIFPIFRSASLGVGTSTRPSPFPHFPSFVSNSSSHPPPSFLPLPPRYASRLLGRTCSSLRWLLSASVEVNANKLDPLSGTYLFARVIPVQGWGGGVLPMSQMPQGGAVTIFHSYHSLSRGTRTRGGRGETPKGPSSCFCPTEIIPNEPYLFVLGD